VADHFSGPRALAGPLCDICDVFAFPSPEQPGNFTLVMNVFPKAALSSFFSDSIVCRFRVRPVSIAGVGPAAAFAPGQKEFTFDVTFAAASSLKGGDPQVQEAACRTPTGEVVSFLVNDDKGMTAKGLRVYAGCRSDPFFIDVDALRELFKTGRLAFKNPGTHSLAGTNVLSIVVEFDCAMLLASGRGPLFAIVGETITSGKLPIRLERFGRPEVKNVLLGPRSHDSVNRTIELRDLYNLEDGFHVGPDYREAYRTRISSNLAFLDSVDGKTDWPLGADGIHPLTDLILADFFVVDVSKPYAEDSFLEIERATLDGRPHSSCGGRSLNVDVMDALYTLYVNGGNGPRISDGVDQATAPASRVFPYLAPRITAQDLPESFGDEVADATNSYEAGDGPGHVHQKFGRFQL
jgi:hypothetical protein